MTLRSKPRLLAGAALLMLTAASCGASGPTLDERVEDIDAAIELYQAVDGAECDDPQIESSGAEGAGALCEDDTLIAWRPDEVDAATQAEVAGFDGDPRVVGVNVYIERPGLDCEAIQDQIGGVCAA